MNHLRRVVLLLVVVFVVANCLVVPDVVRGLVCARIAGAFAILGQVDRDPRNTLTNVSFSSLYDAPVSMALTRQSPAGAARDVLIQVTSSAPPTRVGEPSYGFARPWHGRYVTLSAPRQPGDDISVEQDLAGLFSHLGQSAWTPTPLRDLRHVLMSLPRAPYERHLRWVIIVQWLSRPVIAVYALALGVAPPPLSVIVAVLLTALLIASVCVMLWLLVRKRPLARA